MEVLDGGALTGQVVWTGDRAIVQNNDDEAETLILQEFVSGTARGEGPPQR